MSDLFPPVEDFFRYLESILKDFFKSPRHIKMAETSKILITSIHKEES